MNYTIHFSQVIEYLPYLIGGAWLSLQVAFLSFCGGMVIGLIGATLKTFGGTISRRVVDVYVSFFTNTPQFGRPNTNVGTPAVGRITVADEPRRIQFGLKYVF